MLRLESSWHGRSVNHVLTYSIRQSRSDLRNLHKLRGKRLVAQVSQTHWFALYSRTGVVFMLRLESSWHGRSVDHVLTYSRRQIMVGSQKPSRITRQKTCCASESNTSVRDVFANRSGFDAPIGVVLAWEEHGSCLNIFWTTNLGQISKTFTNYEAKDLLRKQQIAVGSQKPSGITRQKTCCASESNTSGRVVFAYESGFDAPIGVVLAWVERGSCLNIFRKTNRGRISETFTNYEAKELWRRSVKHVDDKSRSDLRNLHELRGKRLVAQVSQTRRFALYSRTGVVLMLRLESSWYGRSMEHVLTYSGRNIAVGSKKSSRISKQKTWCASESNTSVRVVLANGSRFDAPIGVVLAWEERGSCLNIFRTTNRCRISETFTNYEAKDLLRKQKNRCASESNTSVRVVFANGSGFDAPIGVVLAWEKRGSCLNLFRTTNRGRTSETFTNYEAKDLLRKSVDHVITYSERQIADRSQKPSRITRQKTCCASESNTLVRFVFPNGSGFDAPIGVVLAWEERGSCLNIFRTTNRGRISETFTNYEAKDLLRKNLHELRGKRLVAQVSQTRQFALFSRTGVVLMLRWTRLGMGGAWIMSQHIPDDKSRSDLRNHHELRGKRHVAQVGQTRRFALYSRTRMVLMLRVESSWRGRSVDHVLTYSGRKIAVGSQKPSRISRQRTCCASESNTSVRVVFANRSGFDAPMESSWHGRSVDHVLTYSGRQIAIGSRKPSRITRQNTCCASESNTSVRVVFANGSGFDAPIGVVSAWEERGSCLNIFRSTNRGRISETFTNYEAKDLLRNRLGMGGAWIMSQHIPDDKSRSDLRNLHELRGKRLVAQVTQTRRFVLYSRTGVVLMLRLESSWHSVDLVLTYSGGNIAVGSQKPSRITRQKTCSASESNTSVRIVLANGSGFDAPIGVVLAWEERGSCLNIFWTKNRGRISETFMNYEAKDLLRM
ncbi:uncharacterized protein G2W53_009997 [Senna tora]|uniref:Uncharacterized protein n=1 Tax=Senna tora TaxID=362788 RepID=A0A834X095_9FABA|nr:uncharacterized protein G2W53_009997 [Senna tora]